MRKVGWIAGFLLLAASTLGAAPCAPSPTTLCLNASRFEVGVSWRDSRGRTGVGQAVSITADTGYFWFFSEANIELVIKVLDARSINNKFWVFFGALSSVEYDLTVTDTATGAVKTYHNPLGQFASVGDTGAFDPVAGLRAAHETVQIEGTRTTPDGLGEIQRFIDQEISKSASTFTPCAASEQNRGSLFLSGCRFRVDVQWADSRGRHGAGRPVQLTGDTGYFWFFAETNVELMIKVLNARGINDHFWVFFGALSSVEYTVHVTDTVSGALRTYQNPLGSFASVGDTSAFRGGDGITVQPDSPRAVSGGMLAAEGGSLSVTSANGTAFTLRVPPNSLDVDEVITMTPVASVGQLPFAAGLVAGVDIQPTGVLLLAGATLSIHTPAPVSRSEETPVAWNGSGQDFFLFPPKPAGGDLELQIFHFGGYGVARGTDAERLAQLAHGPVADGDLLSHEISPFLREARGAAALRGPSEPKRIEVTLVQRLDAGYQALRIQMEATDGEPARVVDLIHQTNEWVLEVPIAMQQPMETVFPGRTAEIYALWKRMVSLSLSKIHEACSDDPHLIIHLPPIVRIARLSGLVQRFPELEAEIDAVLRCLTFKLTFDSTISETGGPVSETARVLAADVILRAHSTQDTLFEITGEGEIHHEGFELCCVECPVLLSTTPSTFKAHLYWNRSSELRVSYDTGTPHDQFTVTCPESPPFTFPDFWLKEYPTFHFLDRYFYGALNGLYPYLQRNWTLTGGQDPWAFANSSQTLSSGGLTSAEITRFTLTHTPE